MPTVSVKIDSQSKYTIELDPEYSPDDFIETARKHIKFVNEIVSRQQRIKQPESPTVQGPDPVSEPLLKQSANNRPVKKFNSDRKADSIHRPKTPRIILYISVAVALACLSSAVYLWYSGLGIFTSEEAVPHPSFKSTISAKTASSEQTEPPQKTVPKISDARTVSKYIPPLPRLNKIRIHARELTWIRLGEDNNPAFEVMLRPGNILEREASNFSLKIGNARGVDITFNNQPINVKNPNSTRDRNVVVMNLPGK
jgi:hypothetical protein